MGTIAYALYGVGTLAAVIYATLYLHRAWGWEGPVAYLAAINSVTFVTYAYDKVLAPALGVLHLRVPEKILIWWLAFPGGIVGAVAAMQLFHHKTGPDTQAFRAELARAFFVLLGGLAGAALMYRMTT